MPNGASDFAVVGSVGPERRRAAFADDFAGDALSQMTLTVAVGEQRRARLALDVDEAGRDDQAGRIDDAVRDCAFVRSPTRVMRSPTTPTSAALAEPARAVDDLPAAHDQIEAFRRCLHAAAPTSDRQHQRDRPGVVGVHPRATIIAGTISVSNTVSAFSLAAPGRAACFPPTTMRRCVHSFATARRLRRRPRTACRASPAIWVLAASAAKDESARFGLNAFKLLGARFAIETLLLEAAISAAHTRRVRQRR